MKRWYRLALVLGVLVVLGVLLLPRVGNLVRQHVLTLRQTTMPATPLPGTAISGELTSDLYDCTLTLLAGTSLPAQSRMRVMLEGGRAYRYTALDITAEGIAVLSVNGQAETLCDRISLKIPPAQPIAWRCCAGANCWDCCMTVRCAMSDISLMRREHCAAYSCGAGMDGARHQRAGIGAGELCR